jgi:3-oxoacyl-[acyl-carrier-protein] synthase-3
MRGPPYARIVSLGSYLPHRVVTNADLAESMDTSDEWIRSRTGIAERRIADETETTSVMALAAASAALDRAAVTRDEVDLLIVATSTPDYTVFPSAACLVQDGLGLTRAGAFDLGAACSGFVYAMITGAQFISSGAYRTVLVVGSDSLCRFLDFNDRTTAVLFGDGAGAAVMQATDDAGGLLSFVLGSDGSGGCHLMVPAGGSLRPPSEETVAQGQHTIQMNGREVYRFSTTTPVTALQEAASGAGIAVADLDLVVAHQANVRILQTMARNLHLPEERFYANMERYGNTSAASVPLALCDAACEGKLPPGSLIGFVGFGAGLTWATAIWRWQGLQTPT